MKTITELKKTTIAKFGKFEVTYYYTNGKLKNICLRKNNQYTPYEYFFIYPDELKSISEAFRFILENEKLIK